MKKNKIIFLDFDGVIVTGTSHYKLGDPEAIKQLNRIIKETNAKVIVHSAWKTNLDYDIKLIQEKLEEWGFIGEVIDTTDTYIKYSIDQVPIYLRSHPEITEYVMIDDVPVSREYLSEEDYDLLINNSVNTKHDVGLTEDGADKAISILLGK